MNMQEMLNKARLRVTPATVVDVGASDGRWSAMAMDRWPLARYLCIEADARHYEALGAFCDARGAKMCAAMAGEQVGVGNFASSPTDPFGGAGADTPTPMTAQVPSTTVDRAVGTHGMHGPYLLKLDTHGYELQILRGAAHVVNEACALVVEVYACKLQPGALHFWELCSALHLWGFLPTAICDVMERPIDGRLWQFDMLFERKGGLVGVPRYK